MQPHPTPRRDDENGFTLVEFLISTLVMTLVLGSAVGMSMQLQQAYGMQLDDASAEQEARYALDWIARDLRSAGSDPYKVIDDTQEIWIDPDGGADNDDSVRIDADIHCTPGCDPNPDGPDGDNADPGEKITIAFDPEAGTITRQDENAGDVVGVAMTDPIFTDLSFTWLTTDKNETNDPKLVSYVRVQVTAESKAWNRFAEEIDDERHTRIVLSTEVRLRTR